MMNLWLNNWTDIAVENLKLLDIQPPGNSKLSNYSANLKSQKLKVVKLSKNKLSTYQLQV